LTSRTRKILGWIAVGWTLIALVALVVVMSGLFIDRSGTDDAGRENLQGLWTFWLSSGAIWLGLTGLWWGLIQGRGDSRQVPIARPQQDYFARITLVVVAVAVVARVLVIVTHQPSLSDDVYRYVFDGRNLASGQNPYLVVPIDRAHASDERWPGERELVPLLAYPELPTPYLPLSHLVFGGMGAAIVDSWSDPASSARLFRIGFVLIESAMMVMIAIALRRHDRSPWMLALYAWHPLPIAEIAGSGHQDVIGIALLVAGLTWWTSRAVPPASASAASAARAPDPVLSRGIILIALSAMVKPVTIPAAAFMLRHRPWTDWLKSLVVGMVVCVLMAAPFLWLGGQSGRVIGNWHSTATFMGEKSAHFAGLYETAEFAMRHVMPVVKPDGTQHPPGWNLVQELRARRLCLALLGTAGILILWSRRGDPWSRSMWLMLATVLLAPSAQPWYLLWGFALLPMAFSATMWVYSCTITLGYVYFATGRGFWLGEVWTVNPSVLALGYVPVVIVLGIEWWWRRNGGGSASGATSAA